MTLRTLAILVWLSITTETLGDSVKTCPLSEDLSICSCERMSYASEHGMLWVSVRCQNVTDEVSLARELQMFDNLLITSLELNYFNLNSLPKSIFKGLHIETIELNHGKFKSLVPESNSGSWFEGSLLGVMWVTFYNTSIGHFDWSVFTNLYDMDRLQLSENCAVERFSRWDSLGKMTNLSSFMLTDNNLTRINRAVSKLKNLSYLDMSRNSIAEISRKSFPKPANRLSWICLGNNQIQTLPFDIFEEMPQLRYVILKYNQLTVISQDIFVPIAPNIRALFIRGNPLHCDYDALWILRTIHENPRFCGFNDLKYITCDSPDKVRGKNLKELNEYDLEIDNNIAK